MQLTYTLCKRRVCSGCPVAHPRFHMQIIENKALTRSLLVIDSVRTHRCAQSSLHSSLHTSHESGYMCTDMKSMYGLACNGANDKSSAAGTLTASHHGVVHQPCSRLQYSRWNYAGNDHMQPSEGLIHCGCVRPGPQWEPRLLLDEVSAQARRVERVVPACQGRLHIVRRRVEGQPASARKGEDAMAFTMALHSQRPSAFPLCPVTTRLHWGKLGSDDIATRQIRLRLSYTICMAHLLGVDAPYQPIRPTDTR